MNWKMFLTNELELRQGGNVKYSLRAFAQFLKISPAQLSKILSGKKEVTPKLALQLAEAFGLSATETLLLMKSPSFLNSSSEDQFHVLDNGEVNELCNWMVFAVMSLCEVTPNQATAAWIGKKLNLAPALAQQVLTLLLKKMYIQIEGGQLRRSTRYLRTRPDVSSAVVRRHHKQVMRLAVERLDQLPIDQREFGSYMVSMNKKRMPAAKKMIRKFIEEFCQEFEQGKKTDVISLSIQLFPVTQF
jgi:uncharacterized protein (TIGR02147 family)